MEQIKSVKTGFVLVDMIQISFFHTYLCYVPLGIWFDTKHDQFVIILNFRCTNVTILTDVKKLAFLRRFTTTVSVIAFENNTNTDQEAMGFLKNNYTFYEYTNTTKVF